MGRADGPARLRPLRRPGRRHRRGRLARGRPGRARSRSSACTSTAASAMPRCTPDEAERASLTDARARPAARGSRRSCSEEFGYIAIQSTRPQTLAYGLHDSPVGQLAWIMDKFREWTAPGDRPARRRRSDRDRLLTNVMLYWLTGTAGSAGVRRLRAGTRLGRDRRRTPACRPAVDRVRPRRRDPPLRRDARTPSRAGPTSTAAATSPPWRSPSCSPPTSGSSSATCADARDPLPACPRRPGPRKARDHGCVGHVGRRAAPSGAVAQRCRRAEPVSSAGLYRSAWVLAPHTHTDAPSPDGPDCHDAHSYCGLNPVQAAFLAGTVFLLIGILGLARGSRGRERRLPFRATTRDGGIVSVRDDVRLGSAAVLGKQVRQRRLGGADRRCVVARAPEGSTLHESVVPALCRRRLPGHWSWRRLRRRSITVAARTISTSATACTATMASPALRKYWSSATVSLRPGRRSLC